MKYIRGGGLIAAKKAWWENGVGRTLIEMVGGIFLGILLPRASVYEGLMPFGIGLAASVSGPGTVLVYLAVMMGYLLQGSAVSLRYMAALIVVAGIRWAISGFRSISRSAIFPAAVVFVGLLVTGSALLLSASPTVSAILTVIAESLLGSAFAYFMTIFGKEMVDVRERPFSIRGQLSAMVLTAVLMMALLTVEFSGIAPGRILCGVLILLAARCARITGGAPVGILMGVAVLLSTPDMGHLAPAFALGGVLSAVFSEKGKWVMSLIYLLSVGIATVQASNETVVIIGLYEAAASCLLFVVLPSATETFIERTFLQTRQLPEVYASRKATALKMEYAAKAMMEVVGTVDTVSSQLASLGAPEIGGLCRECTDEVCGKCKKRTMCWESHFSAMMDSLNHAIPHLREKGKITVEDFSGYLRSECHAGQDLAECLTIRYREFLAREAAFRRLHELRAIVNDQFASMATMLEEFAHHYSDPEWSDVETEKRIRRTLAKEKIEPLTLSCRVSDRGRMTVEILLDGNYQPHDKGALRRKFGELCGRTFAQPITEYASGVTRISFMEENTYRVAVGTAQLICKGEKLCGDAYEIFRDSEGRQLLVLSDGMGSGGRAAVDSAMAAGLAVRLLKAGFGYESVLKMINTALMAKSEDESLATLDIVDINLFSGNVCLLKAGAGASLLYSKGRVSRIEESSLPLGILRELTFARTHDRLVEGDILVTMSDGVSNEGLSWVEEILKTFASDNEADLSELAETIAHAARERQGADEDDITVLVAQLRKTA
ncbi:MAG: SpoIIE family protein phosphatase [Clostridia bacterium]|nr:SpoIIE family protein phosphatase [Clostridia bacterium]